MFPLGEIVTAKRGGFAWLGVRLGAVATWCLVGVVIGAQPAPPESRRSVMDKVYTEAQAGRGEVVYARHCESCHGTGLDGDAAAEVPALVAAGFLQRWSGRTVDDLLVRLQRSMPQAAPGSLSATEYAEVIAYIFKTNGFPSGFEALGTDAERLRRILIERADR